MPIVGIPIDVLYTMLIAAFGIPFIVLGFIYFAWVPKPSKAYIKAKMLKRHVDIDANDMGLLDFVVGRIQGPGVFSNKEQFTTFVPRLPESWINKSFGADGIRTILSYSGKAVCGTPETMAILELNKLFGAERLRLKEENPDVTDEEIYKTFVANHPEAQKLLEGLHDAKINIDSEDEAKDGKKKLLRKVAIILDPRILRTYISKNVGGSQLKYLGKINYLRGVAETESPMTKFKGIFLIIIIVMIIAAIAAIVMLTMGSGTQVKIPGT